MRDVRRLELGDVFGAELERERGDGVVELLEPGRADDRRGHLALREQPGERDLRARAAEPRRHRGERVGDLAIGVLIGAVCGLVSAGGAFMTVPFMLFCGVPMTTAIGTGAALGVPVALIGTLGYVFSGRMAPELPPLALGFVYVPPCSESSPAAC